MSPAKANRINGLEYVEVAPDTWAAIASDGTVVASARHRKPGEAIKQVVELVYALNRHEAMERDKWRCVRCGSFRNLQAHHKKHRGLGGANRDDRVDNLETLDEQCHRKSHGG